MRQPGRRAERSKKTIDRQRVRGAIVGLVLGLVGLGSASAVDASLEAADQGDPIDLVIALDTSGTMRGLLDAARVSLWEVVNDLAALEPTPRLRVAIISFGNQSGSPSTGWVRLETDLTADIDLVSERLFSLESRGANEYVGRVLRTALEELSWSGSEHALKLLFVAGNESADQDQEIGFREMSEAVKRAGISLSAIFCGGSEDEEAATWKEMAELAEGRFATVDHAAGAIVTATPFDRELGELGALLNATYLPLGEAGREEKKSRSRQDRNARSMGAAVAATRAQTKGSALYASQWDLVDAVTSGRIRLDEVDPEKLPRDLRSLSPEELLAVVEEMAGLRDELRHRITELAAQRRAVVSERLDESSRRDDRSFDRVVRQTVREKAREMGYSLPRD